MAFGAGAVVHVVLVEWAESADADVAEQASTKSTENLTTLDGVVSVTSGPNIGDEQLQGGFDWMLAVHFRDRAALDGYLPHPQHLEVAGYLQESAARIVVFDVAA
jgi:hypothetical protein